MASREEMQTIRSRAYNDTARAMQAEGVELTHRQADDLGDEGLDWLRDRLGLTVTADDSGVTAEPAAVRS